MRVVFMGTPDIAATCLKKILADGFEVVGVYTQPDRPKGRGMKMVFSPVKEVAISHNIPVFQPENFRSDEDVQALRDLKPDVCAVVAYGRILPQRVLDIAALGNVNIHASLLPQYRGSAPYQWAVLDGLTETGVTAQHMALQMDAGDIIDVAKTPIGENETAEELFERLSVISAELMVSTLEKAEKGELKPQKQVESEATYAPIIKKEMAFIDFKSMTAREIFNAVRGYYSWPCAFFFLDGKRIKVIKTAIGEKSAMSAGCVAENGDSFSVVAADGITVKLLEIQPEGSKAMTAKQFLNGKKIAVGTVIGEENA